MGYMTRANEKKKQFCKMTPYDILDLSNIFRSPVCYCMALQLKDKTMSSVAGDQRHPSNCVSFMTVHQTNCYCALQSTLLPAG